MSGLWRWMRILALHSGAAAVIRDPRTQITAASSRFVPRFSAQCCMSYYVAMSIMLINEMATLQVRRFGRGFLQDRCHC